MSPYAERQAGETVKRWFEEMDGQAHLVLPDGPFGGRPYETIPELTHLLARPRKLLIELDEQLLLVFTEPGRVEVEGRDLVIDDYAQCVFDWQEYVNFTPHGDKFRAGEFRFEPPPHKT